MSKHDPFKELHDSIQNNRNLYRIIEDSIPLSVQTAYFKLSNKVRAEEYDCEYDLWHEQLFDKIVGAAQKKRILLQLAASKEIKGLRLLEKYAEIAEGELVHWVALAILEARVQIESDILGERPVIVASGLGGKESKLRFFVVLAIADGVEFTEYQETMLEREIAFYAKKYEYEIEEIRIHSTYATVTTLIPLKIDKPGILFETVIEECNAYGNFLRNDYILTNVRFLSDAEIRRTLNRINS